MGYKKTETYTPFVAGDYSKDKLVQVTKVFHYGEHLRVIVREHMGDMEDYPGDAPTQRMRYMALYSTWPDEVIRSCRIVSKFYTEGGWHKVFEIQIAD